MFKQAAVLGLAATAFTATALAQVGPVPTGVPSLDHVFLIMMENHGYQQIKGNPNEPYVNSLINGHANVATNYFAVGHPSLTNYLEIVGGSNFGVRSDNAPKWGSVSCSPNIVTGIVNADDGGGASAPGVPSKIDTGNICPISGSGKDAATPAVDTWNEVGGPFVALADIDGVKSVPAEPVMGMTIADQLSAVGLQWKSYEQSLPLGPIWGVNYSDGTATNLTNFKDIKNGTTPLSSSDLVQLYAVKHNPFAYFKSVQDGTGSDGLANVGGFPELISDLTSGDLPAFSFIVPDQCHDQHGRSNADTFCAFDPGQSGYTYGTQAGLNGGLILAGDTTIERLVNGIKASPAWQWGRNAIVIVWDENDYSGVTKALPAGALFPSANQNRVVLTVQTNYQGKNVGKSSKYYNSFSLLKSLESAFGLPCLNHACDKGVDVMSDLFAIPAAK